MQRILSTKGRVVARASDDPEHFGNWYGLLAACIEQAKRDLAVTPSDYRHDLPTDLEQAEAAQFLDWARETFLA